MEQAFGLPRVLLKPDAVGLGFFGRLRDLQSWRTIMCAISGSSLAFGWRKGMVSFVQRTDRSAVDRPRRRPAHEFHTTDDWRRTGEYSE